jgi:YVTN family beta-propeller protein
MHAVFILCCIVSLSTAQYVESTIPLLDSISGLTGVGSLVYHSSTNTIYVGGYESYLVAVNAQTNSRAERVAVGYGPHLLCSDPIGNKIYSFNYGPTATVIDGATNQAVKTIPVVRYPSEVCYSGRERKLYWINTFDSLVRVIDCVGDSMVAQIVVAPGPVGLCYNSFNNRLYCAQPTTDDATVIDCAADTIVGTIWVRGIEPRDICYDSVSNCVYTANYVSGTVSAIDCAGDTIVRLVAVGREPVAVVAGLEGKVYCANYYDSSVSVVSGSGVKTLRTSKYPQALSFDPVNNKVYCAGGYYSPYSVTVIDAAQDTVLANIGTGSNSEEGIALCYNPAGNNTYVACKGEDMVSAIGGMSDTVEAVITVGACNPGPLCYNTTDNRLYCLDCRTGLLFVIDGDSSRLLKTLMIPGSVHGRDTLVWNSVSDKVYFTNWYYNRVSILDCAGDSLIGAVETGVSPRALCCSDGGKVYVVNEGGGVAVIDGSGDSLLAIVPINNHPGSLCYDRTDNKVYVGWAAGYVDTVSVIDADGDSVVARIPVSWSSSSTVCWNQNHDKVYVGGSDPESVPVIDCTSDTVLRNLPLTANFVLTCSDSVCDKVYIGWSGGSLYVILPSTDTVYPSLNVGGVTALIDNGKPGPANRLYCTDFGAGMVTVVNTYKTDTILCRITVGDLPYALAWNPLHSRVYVSNSGSSSISVIRDTIGVGVEESWPQASSHKPQVTLVRGVLNLEWDCPCTGTVPKAELLDISGRKVLDLKSGANDVRALAPGVYFVRVVSYEPSAVSCYKVVVTR